MVRAHRENIFNLSNWRRRSARSGARECFFKATSQRLACIMGTKSPCPRRLAAIDSLCSLSSSVSLEANFTRAPLSHPWRINIWALCLGATPGTIFIAHTHTHRARARRFLCDNCELCRAITFLVRPQKYITVMNSLLIREPLKRLANKKEPRHLYSEQKGARNLICGTFTVAGEKKGESWWRCFDRDHYCHF
jgi:hypothetical protein